MNDRFAAQLRTHLLEFADDRPSDGQLAAVVDAVAATRQRLPLVARLTWNPDRIGLFPAAAVRLGLVAAALALAMVAGAMLAGGPSGPTTVFEGTWTSTDPGDGSALILVVGPGNAPAVYFEDGYATGEACVNDQVKRFTARSTGEISGNRLLVEFPDGGGCGLVTVAVGLRYDYVAATDTLIDHEDVVWNRALGEDRNATPEPATGAPAAGQPTPDQPVVTGPLETEPVATAEASNPGPKCFDIPAGTTYTSPVDDLSLTVAIPATAAFRWQGNRKYFGLEDYCYAGGPVVILASMVDLVRGSCGHSFGRPPSAAIAVKWLTETADYRTSEPIELSIGGYRATRFEVSFESSPCPDEFEVWDGSGLDRSSVAIVYIVDVEPDGVPLGITILNRGGEAPAAQVAEAEAIVASMQVEP